MINSKLVKLVGVISLVLALVFSIYFQIGKNWDDIKIVKATEDTTTTTESTTTTTEPTTTTTESITTTTTTTTTEPNTTTTPTTTEPNTIPTISEPTTSPSTIFQQPLTSRKFNKTITLDKNAHHSCLAQNFTLNISHRNTATIFLQFTGMRSDLEILEIGSLPDSIDIKFLNNSNYEYRPQKAIMA